MEASRQSVERVDARFGPATTGSSNLEPGLDWLVVLRANPVVDRVDFSEPARISETCNNEQLVIQGDAR